MKRESTQVRLLALMRERNIKQIDILNKCEPLCLKYDVKLGKSDLSQYVNGKTEPSQDKLVILGMALEVSEAWLMGFDVPMERNNSHNSRFETPELDSSENELIFLYRSVNNQGQEKIVDYAGDIASSDKYKKADEYTMVEKSS